MKPLLGLCLALLVRPASGSDNPVVVYARTDSQLPAQIQEELRTEVGQIMADAGYQIEWRSLAALHRGETAAELAVVTFHGGCAAEDSARPPARSAALGWTHISDGVVLPFAEVDCDRVYALLAPRVKHMQPTARGRTFARALGRVVAHELYHIFTHGAPHGSSGVAKPVYGADELTTEHFAFASREADLLQRSGSARTP
jgi:hypothetical protein